MKKTIKTKDLIGAIKNGDIFDETGQKITSLEPLLVQKGKDSSSPEKDAADILAEAMAKLTDRSDEISKAVVALASQIVSKLQEIGHYPDKELPIVVKLEQEPKPKEWEFMIIRPDGSRTRITAKAII